MHVFPTPESPMSNNRIKISYLLAITRPQQTYMALITHPWPVWTLIRYYTGIEMNCYSMMRGSAVLDSLMSVLTLKTIRSSRTVSVPYTTSDKVQFRQPYNPEENYSNADMIQLKISLVFSCYLGTPVSKENGWWCMFKTNHMLNPCCID